MNEKTLLLQRIAQAGLAADDLKLYLDTHTGSCDALALYAQKAAAFAELEAEYNLRFGPVTAYAARPTYYWDWIEDPWPWETEV